MAIFKALFASSVVAMSLLAQAATPVNALAAPAHAHAARNGVTPNHNNAMMKRMRKRNTNPLRKRCVAQNTGSDNNNTGNTGSTGNSGGSDNSGSTGDSGSNNNNNNNGGGGGNVITGGFATYYWQNGNAGACGNYHSDWDLIGAIDVAWYGDMGQQSQYCGRSVTITNLNNGKSVTITVADVCPTCDTSNSFDLSYGAFTAIASESDGEVPITWYFN